MVTRTPLSVSLYVHCLSGLADISFHPASLTDCHTAKLIGTNTPECWCQCYVTQLNSVLRHASGVLRNFVGGGGGQQIQLRTEERGNGDLGLVAL